jgi:5-formyltetrahydrofolate cyclo-ligase
MLKKEARKLYKAERLRLPAHEILKLDDLLLIRFQMLPIPFVSVLFSFQPLVERNEIDPYPITRFLQFQNPGLIVAYPKTNFTDNSMQAIACNDDSDFEANHLGIAEPVSNEPIDPQEIDIVLVPLLAFDERGFRVGYGKGFYDSFLKLCRNDCIKVGLSYFEALPLIEDANDFDVPLNYCITPQKVYVF